MAVLYRINALSRVLEEAFRDAQIPYVIARGTAFYDRKEIKDAIAYLRLVANPSDEVSLRRIVNVPARGIGNTTLDKIEIFAIQKQINLFEAIIRVEEINGLTARAVNSVKKFAAMVQSWRAMDSRFQGDSQNLLAASHQSTQYRATLADLVERIIRESGMEAMYKNAKAEEERERFDNLEELISAASEFVPPLLDDGSAPEWPLLATLTAYLESVALVSDADAIDPEKGAVTLMTLHAAKGLEFDTVALAGLEEGLLPHSRAATSESELEEERRLCYVGITRAKRHLLLTCAKMRTHRGMRERTIPSQFLRELPSGSVVTLDRADDDSRADDSAAHPGLPPSGRQTRRPSSRDRDEFGEKRRVDYEGWTQKSRAEAQFPVGCRVMHPKFGLGTIEGVTPRPGGTSVRVSFRSVGTKTLILEYAKLERVD